MRAFEQRHWTDTRTEDLKALAADGLSASQIAGELGGISRNAVIGKLYRMGISLLGPHGGSMPRPKRGAVERRTPFRAPPQKIQKVLIQPKRNSGNGGPVNVVESFVIDLPPDQSEFACTIDHLGSVTEMVRCRWPLGQPSADMLYCGAECTGTYCARHHRIAYQPAGRRR